MPFDACVYVVMPVHNRWDKTRQSLDCLRKQTHRNLRIIVVDDGSTDGTSEHAKRDYPEVTVLQGDGNLWWSGGVNMGIEFSLREASKYDFLLILNNDLSFGENLVADLCQESIEKGRAAVVAVSRDNHTGDLVDTGMIVDWKGARIVAAHKWSEGDPPAEPDAFTTRGLLLPVAVVSAAGKLRVKELPHYLSDVEYTLRIRKLGLPIFRSTRVTASLDTSTTGIRVEPGTRSPWRDIRDHLFDYRSPSNIVHWMRFLWISCPMRHLPRWVLSILISETKFATKALLASARRRS